METKDLDSWAEFPDAIREIRDRYAQRELELPDGSTASLPVDIVFRGQGNSDWSLDTTLERTSDWPYSIITYMERATSVHNAIESISDRKWDIPIFPEIRKELNRNRNSLSVYLPCYEYLVYLRHLGFPSPFLDWTFSPYVAAYFAFESARSDRCAVYAFIERPEGAKSKFGGEPTINFHGPYVTTHVRHFAQKAMYTTSTQWIADKKEHRFCSHHNAESPTETWQDILIKLTIPTADRLVALKELDDFNINHYTLFQSEDALIRWQGIRAFELEL